MRWPPPLRERRDVTVLVRSPWSARALVAGIGFYWMLAGWIIFRYADLYVNANEVVGVGFMVGGALALASWRSYWSHRWLAVLAGTMLAGFALLHGLTIVLRLGADSIGDAVMDPEGHFNDAAAFVSGGRWILTGCVIFAVWPGLVHDSTVRACDVRR